MKTKAFFIAILVVFTTNFLSSQSLQSQLKLIFGDALSTFGKSDFLRFAGKSLSTSGNMQYNIELIKAQNNQTLNINMPPNTYLGPNNQVLPNQGYQWANPSNLNDYSVAPLSSSSYPSLPLYDLNYLNRKFDYNPIHDPLSSINHPSTLNILFTYNWYNDLNGNGYVDLPDFNNIKRTFYVGEPVSYCFSFVVRSGSKRSGEDMGDAITFLIQIFNATTGEPIIKKDLSYHNVLGLPRHEGEVYKESLGNYFPSGKYMITVNITSINRFKNGIIGTLREYFEVLE
jgi:hypothetical protein